MSSKGILTKLQRQQLGEAIALSGYSPKDFLLIEDIVEERPIVRLSSRESRDELTIQPRPSDGYFSVKATVPGTDKKPTYAPMRWDDVIRTVSGWADEVKQENIAVDPWEQEAEDMANDDGYFSLVELPKVDLAIDASLASLQEKAIAQGQNQKKIEAELDEIKGLLKKAARSSTKKEWMSLFKGLIVGKLVDWGMQTQLFQDILHTLISSAQGIAQLAEHAAHHLL